MERKEQVATSLEQDLIARIDKVAAEQQRSRSATMRYIIINWLDTQDK